MIMITIATIMMMMMLINMMRVIMRAPVAAVAEHKWVQHHKVLIQP
jgi:hypothetical protein